MASATQSSEHKGLGTGGNPITAQPLTGEECEAIYREKIEVLVTPDDLFNFLSTFESEQDFTVRAQIARDAGLSMSTVQRVFNGERTPSLLTAYKMAKAMRMSLDKFCEKLEALRPPKPQVA